MRRLWTAAVCLSLLAACEGPPTQILVIVDAQPLVRAQARGLQVRIWGRSRGDGDFVEGPVHEATEAVAPFSWPRQFAIAPDNRDASRLWRFEATGTNDARAPFVVTRVISGYQNGESLQVVLVLHDSCIGELCSDDLNSACDPVTLECSDAMRDPGELDPLSDGGVYDAAFRGMVCDNDGDCDDGRECTLDSCVAGACAHVDSDTLCEAVGCTSGRCLAGVCIREPVDGNCDDGLDCTVDRCQMDGTCMGDPDNMVCDLEAGGSCDPENGCQYPTCTPTNCTSTSACVGATCNGTDCERPPLCTGPTSMCCDDACVPMGCDDGNPCTADSCGPMGCVSDPVPLNGMGCDDMDGCTLNTTCNAGVCGDGLDCAMQAPECQAGSCNGGSCSFSSTNEGGVCMGGMPGCPNRCVAGSCQAQMCGSDAGPPLMDAGPPPMDAGSLCDMTCPGMGCCQGVTCCDMTMGFTCSGTTCVPPPMDGGSFCDMTCPGMGCCDGLTCCDLGANMCVGPACVPRPSDGGPGPGTDSGMIMVLEGGV